MSDKKLILHNDSNIVTHTHDQLDPALAFFQELNQSIGCTYISYISENTKTKQMRLFNTNQTWQDLLVGGKLINNCPLFSTAWNFFEYNRANMLMVSWQDVKPQNRSERNTCGLREEYNIANGFAFLSKYNGIRESISFAGNKLDKSFNMNFIADPDLLRRSVIEMRKIVTSTSTVSQSNTGKIK